MMIPFLLAGAFEAVEPSACPMHLAVEHLNVKTVVSRPVGTFDDAIITVNVRNDGKLEQSDGGARRLVITVDNKERGTQPIPRLGINKTYTATFHIAVPHDRGPTFVSPSSVTPEPGSNLAAPVAMGRKMILVSFQYVVDDRPVPNERVFVGGMPQRTCFRQEASGRQEIRVRTEIARLRDERPVWEFRRHLLKSGRP